MGTGAITQHIDIAQLVLYAFWIFFAGLVYYLARENHREGYPLDTDRGISDGWPTPKQPKFFRLSSGEVKEVPRPESSTPTLNARPINHWTGAPLEPVGNPLLAGVGPGSWSERADVPDLDFHGAPKVVPLRTLPDFDVDPKSIDPRGADVIGADGLVAGVVRDLWVDNSDVVFRYLEVEVASNGRIVLLPWTFSRVTRSGVKVHAIKAEQFADVPGTRNPDIVTFLEEDKITAYFGAGLLYADESRAEPLL
jgi:photosynthetic reaction center H subunit